MGPADYLRCDLYCVISIMDHLDTLRWAERRQEEQGRADSSRFAGELARV